MEYFGNNPYVNNSAYAQALREAEERKKRMQLEAMMKQAGADNAYGIAPKQYRALSNDTSATEAKIKNQMDYADSLRGTKSAGPRQLGNVVVNNPWEGLEVGFNRALGGYLAGKANKKLDALDAEKDEKAAALAAVEEAKYQTERDDEEERQRLARNADGRADNADGRAQSAEEREAGLYPGRLTRLEQEIEAGELANEGAERDLNDRLAGDAGDAVVYERNGEFMTVYPVTQGANVTFRKAGTNEEVNLDGWQEVSAYGRGGKSYNQPRRFVDGDGTSYMLTFDKGEGVFRFAGGPQKGEAVPPELFQQLEERAPFTENQLERVIEGYENDVKPLRDLQTDITRAEKAISELDLEEGEDIFGYFTKMKGPVGDLARANDEKVQNAFAAIQTVVNTITRQRAGLSQTLAEMDNIKAEMGNSSIFTDPAVFGQYWERLKDKVASDMGYIESRLSPTARGELDRRSVGLDGPKNSGRGIGGKVNQEPQANDPLGLGKDLDEYTSEELEEYLGG